MRREICPTGFRRLDPHNTLIRVMMHLALIQDIRDILTSLINVPLDIHRETRGLRDRKPEIQRDRPGHTSQTNKQPPHVIDGVKLGGGCRVEDGVFVGGGDDEGDEGGGEVAPALGGEDGGHHASTDFGRGKFGGDHCG